MSDLREQLALYVLDELEPTERAAVEEALRRDPELRREEAAWRLDIGELLAESAPEAELSSAELDAMSDRLVAALPGVAQPDPAAELPTRKVRAAEIRAARVPVSDDGSEVKDEPVLNNQAGVATARTSNRVAIEEERFTSAPLRPAGPSAWVTHLALAASLLSMIVAATAFFSMRSDDGAKRLAQLEQRNAELEQELAGLREGLQRTDAAVARVSSDLLTMSYPQSSPVVLAGLEAAPEAAGSAFYNPSTREALFHAYGLPQADAGTTYQLWYIPDGGSPVSAGIFVVDGNGEATLQVDGVPSAEQIALWAVTVEPDGGSPQPTGTMVIRS